MVGAVTPGELLGEFEHIVKMMRVNVVVSGHKSVIISAGLPTRSLRRYTPPSPQTPARQTAILFQNCRTGLIISSKSVARRFVTNKQWSWGPAFAEKVALHLLRGPAFAEKGGVVFLFLDERRCSSMMGPMMVFGKKRLNSFLHLLPVEVSFCSCWTGEVLH